MSEEQLDGGGLELDLESHTYSFAGKRVPGVSEILTALGIVNATWFSDFARDRGSAVHSALEYLLTGKLLWDKLDPRIVKYVEAAVRFLDDAKADRESACVERPVWNPTLRYAGTPDLVTNVFGAPAIVDWKTGGTGAAGLATAAYDMAIRCEWSVTTPLRRMAVQLKPDGTYKKTDLKDPNDFIDFQAAARLFNRFHINRKDKTPNE